MQTDVMVNGLDFYPTILSWVGAKPAKDKQLDGADISRLLNQDPTDASLISESGAGASLDAARRARFWAAFSAFFCSR